MRDLDKSNKQSWDSYFMQIAEVIAQRSTCLRRKVGAIIVKDKRILTTGYNGAPTGLRHCVETGCLRENLAVPSGKRAELCRGVHAEQNAIIQAAYHGVRVRGAILYCTNQPCSICTKILINAGIKSIYYKADYDDKLAREILTEAKIKQRRIG